MEDWWSLSPQFDSGESANSSSALSFVGGCGFAVTSVVCGRGCVGTSTSVDFVVDFAGPFDEPSGLAIRLQYREYSRPGQNARVRSKLVSLASTEMRAKAVSCPSVGGKILAFSRRKDFSFVHWDYFFCRLHAAHTDEFGEALFGSVWL